MLHKIDVHNMHKHRVLKCMKFDVVIYNFPHAGHFSWLGERDMELIEYVTQYYQDVVFLKSMLVLRTINYCYLTSYIYMQVAQGIVGSIFQKCERDAEPRW